MRTLVFLGTACASLLVAAQVNWNELPLPEGTFNEHTGDFRSDTIDIPLGAHGELEYKLGIEAGNAIVYEWNVVDIEDPNLLYSEFHGHTPPVDDVGDLMYYRTAEGGTERGSLVAPFSGIHGWYLVNGSDEPIVVRLEVAGYYEILPQ
jgi:hypothetical protein